MSRPRFLADHDFNEHIVTGVLRREPVVEFVRARDIGYDDRPDVDVLEYAASERLIIVSHDVNTMPAAAYDRLANGKEVAGLLMVQQTSPVSRIIEDLLWSGRQAKRRNGGGRFSFCRYEASTIEGDDGTRRNPRGTCTVTPRNIAG